MSKSSKTRRSEERKKQKRNRKLAQQALYESYKASGSNKKSKRNKLNVKRKAGINTHKHEVTNCGNLGCSNCFAHLAAPRMNNSNDPRVRVSN